MSESMQLTFNVLNALDLFDDIKLEQTGGNVYNITGHIGSSFVVVSIEGYWEYESRIDYERNEEPVKERLFN